MKRLFRRAFEGTKALLGISVLSHPFLQFAFVHFLFAVFTNLNGVYINTLFVRYTGSPDIVLTYNAILYPTIPVFMVLLIFFIKKYSPVVATRIGIVGYNLLYISFFAALLMGKLRELMPVLAMVSATGAAFYWISYSVLVSSYSEDNSRDVALGLIGLSGSVCTIAIPFLAGNIIAAFDGMTGYYVVFGISFLISLYALKKSFSLSAFVMEDKRTHFKDAVRQVLCQKIWRSTMLGEFFKGIREGAFFFILVVLLYQAVQSELIVGINTFVTGLVGLAAFWGFGKIIKPDNRLKHMVIAIVSLSVITGLLFLKYNAVTIILLSVVNAVFVPPILNSMLSIFFLVIERTPGGIQKKAEFITIKELFQNVGRTLGILLFLAAPKTSFGYVSVMLGITLIQFISLFFVSRTIKILRCQTKGETP